MKTLLIKQDKTFTKEKIKINTNEIYIQKQYLKAEHLNDRIFFHFKEKTVIIKSCKNIKSKV